MKCESAEKPEVVGDEEDDADVEGPEVQLVVVGKFETESVKNSALKWALKYGKIKNIFALNCLNKKH